MRDYAKVGGRKGKPGYRTPSRVIAGVSNKQVKNKAYKKYDRNYE